MVRNKIYTDEELIKRKREKNRERYQKNKEREIKRTSDYLKNTPMGRACRLVNNYNWMDKIANRPKGDLTPKWITENIFSKPCAHCGKEGWKIIGCNRIDNSLPHTMDNVEPCCESCNHKLGGANGIKVDQIDKVSGEIVKTWENARVASIEGRFNESHIRNCCNGKRKSHKGYFWKNHPQ